MNKIRIVILVQGEGRGHLTQAITAMQILNAPKYEVCAVIAGTSRFRKIPEFFYQKASAPVIHIISPNLIRDKKNRSVLLMSSLFLNVFLIPRFVIESFKINKIVKKHRPHIILNFHEFLCGTYCFLFRPQAPIVSIAHQYYYYHPNFSFKGIFPFGRVALKLVNFFSTYGSEYRIALHFKEDFDYTDKKIRVLPPLLRNEIKQAIPEHHYKLLVYLLNPGYLMDVLKSGITRNFAKTVCFTDKLTGRLPSVSNVEYHEISDEKYIEHLRTCRYLLCTSGFEAICEANYLGKAVLTFPVDHHPEQKINALEAERFHMAEIWNKKHLLTPKEQIPQNESFVRWVKSAEERFLNIIDEIALMSEEKP